MRPFLEMGRERKLQRVVLLSSSSAAAPDRGALGRNHADREEVVRGSGIAWTFVRPGAFMANDLRWATQIRKTGVVRAPYGSSATAPIDEQDIAAVAVTALREDGHEAQAYILTGPESLTPVQRVDILSEVLGREVTFEEATHEEGLQQMRSTSPAIAENLLAMAAARVGRPAEVSDGVARLTGRPPSIYREWGGRHACDFA